MCMFSRVVASVADTSIFARSSAGGRQFLVYSMKYSADSDLAMILPLPTPPSPPEDAVRFIDLSLYPRFFEDMAKGFNFPVTRSRAARAALGGRPTLKVHEVGSFQASFVPRLQDFGRLDKRFRLPEQTWEQLPQYSDYAFAVFKLQAGAKNVHPMAFEFPRSEPRELFFPTVHVHEGAVSAYADFDHSLYLQTPRARAGMSVSTADGFSPWTAGQFMDVGRTQGIVDAESVVQKWRLKGLRANTDIFVEEKM